MFILPHQSISGLGKPSYLSNTCSRRCIPHPGTDVHTHTGHQLESRGGVGLTEKGRLPWNHYLVDLFTSYSLITNFNLCNEGEADPPGSGEMAFFLSAANLHRSKRLLGRMIRCHDNSESLHR